MAPFWNDIFSLIPQFSSPTAAPLPALGSSATIPASFGQTGFEHPTVIACVRHCGCPFAEAEVKQLASLSNANKELRVIIVCMSDEADGRDWLSRIGGNDFEDQSRVKLICDPKRTTYAELGIGQLSSGALFSGAMWKELFALKEKGIINTETVYGSYRWQNSGGLAVSKGGEVKWVKLAEHAGDMCDYEAAVRSIIGA